VQAQVGEGQVHLAQGAAARHEGAGLQQLLQLMKLIPIAIDSYCSREKEYS
jgi:hypothetical protein